MQPLQLRAPQLALTVATLGAVGFSLASLGWQLTQTATSRQDFLLQNTLTSGVRPALLATLAIGALLPVLVGASAWLRSGPRIEPALHRWGRILGPLAVAFWVPSLFSWQTAQRQTLLYLILLSLFVLAARPLLARSIAELREPSVGAATRSALTRLLQGARLLRVPRYLPLAIVIVAAAGYTAFTAFFTIQNHRLIATSAFDLGIYDNLMFNALHGRPFRSPVLFGPSERSYIAGHAEYAMLFFVPFYAIRPHAETLLLLQSVLLGFAAVPLYLLASHLVSRGAGVVLGVAYLLFAPLHGPHFYDFHWLPLAIFFHFWLYYAIATRRNWLMVSSLVVLLAMREDVAIGICLLGVFLFLTGVRVRLGLALASIAAVFFVVNKFVIMPLAGSWWFENIYSELFADGKASYGSVMVTLISNPVYAVASFVKSVKLQYGLHMVAPLAFLPLRRPAFLLLMLPGAAFTLMTTGYWPTVQISFQYTTHWIPYLFLAAVLGLWLMRFELGGMHRRTAALTVICVAVLSHSYAFGAILQQESFQGGFSKISFEMTQEARARYEGLMSLVRRIPSDASVAATEYLNPHISARKNAYAFRYDFGPVDYILVSRRDMNSDNRRILSEALADAEYGLDAKAADFYLLKRGREAAGTDAALHELGVSQRSR